MVEQGEAMTSKIEVKPGDWVLLKGDSVIASDSDVRKIMEIYDRSGDVDLVISKEPVSRHCYYPAGFIRSGIEITGIATFIAGPIQ
jgi:tartrate dehydratase beta subunit/fumarate hydratase class I family protein